MEHLMNETRHRHLKKIIRRKKDSIYYSGLGQTLFGPDLNIWPFVKVGPNCLGKQNRLQSFGKQNRLDYVNPIYKPVAS